MINNLFRFLVLFTLPLIATNSFAAADSYRYMHVTIETPWAIFVFLLVFIMTPFILMALLYWYFAYKKNKHPSDTEPQSTLEKPSE